MKGWIEPGNLVNESVVKSVQLFGWRAIKIGTRFVFSLAKPLDLYMENGTMLQSFHWYSEGDGKFWNRIGENVQHWAELGINSVWLPPAYKGTVGGFSQGYDVYDIYDLGEFDQKGSVRTKVRDKGRIFKGYTGVARAQDTGLP
ncbi:hypothetical protein ACQ86N_28625 [Puia sp. P3]|uniref:hypothetical protein n=1 Tax=Puia sp. P3 TaxID=3423952 RepID=UPI003D67BB43